MGDLSEHFSASEFDCPCCGLFYRNMRLIYALERLRVACGNQPIKILSGTRCEHWNEVIGGVPRSQHLNGTAADIVVRGLHPLEMAAKAETITEFSHGGIGTYEHNGFIHVDVRYGPARWSG